METDVLQPDFSVRPFIKQEKFEDVQTLTKDEEILASGAENAFWKTLKKHFDNAILQLDQINESAIANGASRDQIGENTIVISLAKGVLRKIENVVEDAKEAHEGGTGE
jgi:hypothetical protein